MYISTDFPCSTASCVRNDKIEMKGEGAVGMGMGTGTVNRSAKAKLQLLHQVVEIEMNRNVRSRCESGQRVFDRTREGR